MELIYYLLYQSYITIQSDLKNSSGRNNLPAGFVLEQNFPNPFNPNTSISFALPDKQDDYQHVSLLIFNMQGQLVQTLVDKALSPGLHTIQWNGMNETGERMPSGIYVYTLSSDDFKTSRKMLLLK